MRPFPTAGPRRARLLVVGLAVGRHGASRISFPMRGDGSGDSLIAALEGIGHAELRGECRPD